jgi:hypothetical protein
MVGGTLPGPSVEVYQRHLRHQRGTNIGAGLGVVEPGRVEGLRGHGALPEEEAEPGQRIVGPDRPDFSAHPGEKPLVGAGGPSRGSPIPGLRDTIGVGRGVGALEGLTQRKRRLGTDPNGGQRKQDRIAKAGRYCHRNKYMSKC